MTTPDTILTKLLTGNSSADALRDLLRVPILTLVAMLQRHEIDGLVTRTKINDCITIYHLTENGRDVAHSLMPATAQA